jgi:small GTP-binding protein
MNIAEEKEQLLGNIKSLLAKKYTGRHQSVYRGLKALLDELKKDVFTVVVLGEFSRGKSTFVNALLGKPLIPMDVLPETATIHAIVYGEKPAVTVVRRDGTKEKGEADIAYLKRFSAQNKALDTADIQYLRIAYPADFLKQRIMLVDTPGVSDMDDQRAEITYGFIPQADAVIFLLDATAPLKKTEKEFIEKRLLPQGISNIIFVANKYDNIDEEEAEETELLDRLERRLNTAFPVSSDKAKLQKIELFPLSSTMALRGVEGENADLLARSGMKTLQKRLQELFSTGEQEQAKLARYRWKYDELIRMLSSEMIAERSIAASDRDSLLRANNQLTDLLAAHQRHGDHIGEYVEKSRQKILAMTVKSLQYFHSHLEDDVMTMVTDYRGTDFKEFVETRLLKRIQKEIDNWLGLYGPHIDQLVQKLGHELAAGLSRHFKEKIQLDTINRSVVQGETYGIQVAANDISYTDVQAGAIAAAGGIGLTLLAGSALMPFVSFAAMPLIRKKLLDQRLGAAKEVLLPELHNQLIQCMVTLQEDLHRKIGEQCSNVEKNVSYAYEQLLMKYQERLQQQINRQETDSSRFQQEISAIDEDLTDLEGYMAGGI